MSDVFAIATKSIFRTLGKDAIYTDDSQNELSVKVIEKSERKNVFDAYTGQYITIGKVISMLRPDSADIKTGETITVGTRVYEIRNIVDDNGYSIDLEVKG